MKRIVIIEDQKAVSDMIEELIRLSGGFEVVGSYPDGEVGIAGVLQSKPDIVVLDLILPNLSGLDVLRRLSEDCPDVRILVFSGQGFPKDVKDVLAAGGRGYVVKTDGFREFQIGLEAVASGGTYLGPQANKSMRQFMRNGGPGQKNLTKREEEVLQLVVEGRTSKEIAKSLGLSDRTIDGHRSKVMKKLDIRDIPSLKKYAIENGLT
ncbi:MAG: response regulator transcription factor [Opitutaceae bacterium]|nr:response regulator transcription factor [Opitutaceae bacterium]